MMKKAFVLTALSSVSMLSADYYSGSYNPSCPGGNCPYQNQGRYYQDSGSGYYNDRPYYQGSSQYQDGRGDQYYYDRSGSEGYYQNRPYDNRYYDNRGGQYQDRNYQDNRSGQYQDRNMDNRSGQYQNSSNTQDRNYQDNRNNQDRDGYYNPSSSGSTKSKPTSYNDSRTNSRVNTNVSDQDIAKEVHDILEADWLSSGYPDVTFDVNNGVVNLRGRVNTMDDKTKLEDSVRKVDGVKQVKSDVTVMQDKKTSSRMRDSQWANNDKNYQDDRSYNDSKVEKTEKEYPRDTAASEQDRHINSKIRHKLSGWFTKGYETIILNTENGVVTITGYVETPDDVQKISKEVKNVEGVKTVNNRVSVQPKR